MTAGVVTRTWTLVFVDYPPSPNNRMHWSEKARHNRKWRKLARFTAYNAGVELCSRIRISATIIRRAIGTADEDNDRARLKPIADGIVDAGAVRDDKRGLVVWGPVDEERGAKGLRIVIEDISAEGDQHATA